VKKKLETRNGLLNKSSELIKLIENKKMPPLKVETASGMIRSQTFVKGQGPLKSLMNKTASSAFKVESVFAKFRKINRASQPVDESKALRQMTGRGLIGEEDKIK
jgi:hypothetical protein